MAASGTLNFEVQSGGLDANGGGFNPGNANMDNTLSATSASGTSATPTVQATNYTFVAGDVGAFLFIQAGTNWNLGWYPITAVAGGIATLNAAIGASDTYGTGLGAGDLGTIQPSVVAGCATVVSPTAGTWSIDYSRQAAAQIAYTDLVIGGTNTQFTSAANPVKKNIIGNVLNVTSGTNFTVQRVEILSTSGTTATCAAVSGANGQLGTAAATGGHGNLGGALLTPGNGGLLLLVSTQYLHIKYNASSYDCTTATAGIAGPITVATNVSAIIQGYDQVRGDRTGNRPAFTWGATTLGSQAFLIGNSGSGRVCAMNLVLDAKNLTNGSCFGLATKSYIRDCVAQNASAAGQSGYSGVDNMDHIYGNNCAVGASSSVSITASRFTNCPIGIENTNQITDCLITGSTNTGYIGNLSNSQGARRCTFDSCAKGVDSTVTGTILDSCLATNCTAYGFDMSVGDYLINCAAYNNTTADILGAPNPTINMGFIHLTADPYVSQGTGDFRLNNNNPGGAQIRGIGTAVWGQTDNQDIGAVQHTDPAGGGANLSRVFSGF